LVRLGHRRIGYEQSNFRIRNFDLRKEGFLQALKEHGLSVLEQDYFSMLPTVISSSQEDFKKEIAKRLNDLPTALFCESDYIAISLIKSLTELNIRIPDDISVIGFDNIHEASIISPELTTVHVYADKMASLAVDRILEMLENNREGRKMKYIVDTEIYERNSCKALKTSD
jgi:DNA-binding LacI/PurR family transcriptional regulator